MTVVVVWNLSVPGCGGLVSLQVGGNHSSEKVTFTSPGYPEGYAHMLDCEWIFETPPGYHMGLVFHDMDLEQSASCYLDYVQVYKGKRHVQCFTRTLITSWPSYTYTCPPTFAEQINRTNWYLADMHTAIWFCLITIGPYVFRTSLP